MKERPILFSAPMVRAILAGTKTQTRRLVKGTGIVFDGKSCPYGVPPDRLWVRETWRPVARGSTPGGFGAGSVQNGAHYAADGSVAWRDHVTIVRTIEPVRPLHLSGTGARWRPSIHMPRWASRLTLEVTAVRVERLQAITEADARTEGVGGYVHGYGPVTPDELRCEPGYAHSTMYRTGFEYLWNEINGKRAPWSSNPWVWVVEFRRVEP